MFITVPDLQATVQALQPTHLVRSIIMAYLINQLLGFITLVQKRYQDLLGSRGLFSRLPPTRVLSLLPPPSPKIRSGRHRRVTGRMAPFSLGLPPYMQKIGAVPQPLDIWWLP